MYWDAEGRAKGAKLAYWSVDENLDSGAFATAQKEKLGPYTGK